LKKKFPFNSKVDKEENIIDDENLKAMKVHKNENSENTYYYKYHWRKGNIAFYRCLSAKCRGRAASVIESLFENEKKILSAKKLRVNKYYIFLKH
jgi:hypothetical protein